MGRGSCELERMAPRRSPSHYSPIPPRFRRPSCIPPAPLPRPPTMQRSPHIPWTRHASEGFHQPRTAPDCLTGNQADERHHAGRGRTFESCRSHRRAGSREGLLAPALHVVSSRIRMKLLPRRSWRSVGRRWMAGGVFLLALLVSASAATVADGAIYWAGYNDGTVGRAHLDGTHVNASLITGGSTPCGDVAVDPVSRVLVELRGSDDRPRQHGRERRQPELHHWGGRSLRHRREPEAPVLGELRRRHHWSCRPERDPHRPDFHHRS